jgi:hypothetical protein
MISTPDGIEAAAGLKKAELRQYSSTLPTPPHPFHRAAPERPPATSARSGQSPGQTGQFYRLGVLTP